jgi:hypothetical protein
MSTTNVNLTGNAWFDLTAGPLTVISPQKEYVLIYSAAAAPGALTDAAQVLLEANVPFNYQYTDKLHMRLSDGGAAAVAMKVIK